MTHVEIREAGHRILCCDIEQDVYQLLLPQKLPLLNTLSILQLVANHACSCASRPRAFTPFHSMSVSHGRSWAQRICWRPAWRSTRRGAPGIMSTAIHVLLGKTCLIFSWLHSL